VGLGPSPNVRGTAATVDRGSPGRVTVASAGTRPYPHPEPVSRVDLATDRRNRFVGLPLAERDICWRRLSLEYRAAEFEIVHGSPVTHWTHHVGTQVIVWGSCSARRDGTSDPCRRWPAATAAAPRSCATCPTARARGRPPGGGRPGRAGRVRVDRWGAALRPPLDGHGCAPVRHDRENGRPVPRVVDEPHEDHLPGPPGRVGATVLHRWGRPELRRS